MSEGVRRFQVGEVRDRRKRRVELLIGHDDLELGRLRDHRVPGRRRLDAVEQLLRIPAERVHDRGVELRAAALTGDRDRRRDAARPVVDLDDVGQAHEPRGHRDGVALRLPGSALAVPALERLPQAVLHVPAQAEIRRERFGGHAMVVEDAVGGAAAVAEEGHPGTSALEERTPGSDVLQHEAGSRTVDEGEVCFERQIVAEPLGLLVGVDVASDPREERGVEDRGARRFVQADALGQAHRDQALPEDVLHGLPQPEVGPQRQDGEELRAAHVGHGDTLGTGCERAGPRRPDPFDRRSTHERFRLLRGFVR